MKDRQDMTEEEHRLQDAREWAARRYRAEGFDDFAKRVERGEVDECSQVRLGKFFIDPAPPPSDEFLAAWKAAAEPALE
jgi:hypothetical protein